MLARDFSNLAMSLSMISKEQAQDLISATLENYKRQIGAIVASVWVCEQTRGDRILEPFVDRGDSRSRCPTRIILNEKTKGLFAWVVENNEPILIKKIPSGANTLTNDLDGGKTIDGRYCQEIYQRTRSFAAVPIEYKGQLMGILSVEAGVTGQLREFHVEALKEISRPTGSLIWKSQLYEDMKEQTDYLLRDFTINLSSNTAVFNPYKTGFIARPFEPESNKFGNKVREVFAKQSIRAISYYHTPGTGLVMANLLEQISSCHFGIADITGSRPNVIFELGGLISARKPVIIVRSERDKSDLPFNISGYQCYTYEFTEMEEDVIIRNPATGSRSQSINDFMKFFIEENLHANRYFQEALDVEDQTELNRPRGGSEQPTS